MTRVVEAGRKRYGLYGWLMAALVAACLIGMPPVHAAGDAAPGPVQVVKTLHAALLKSMKAGSQAGFQGRYDLLQPVVKKTFDFHFIGAMVLGQDWSKLTSDEQQKFEHTMWRYTTANYASQFSSFDGEHFTSATVSDYRKGIKLVKTQLVDSSGKHHDFVYMLHQTQGNWRIINVIADGVSDLSLKRSQYQSVLENQGFATLISKLDQDIKRMSH